MSVLQIEKLRSQLREKFPAAHRAPLPLEETILPCEIQAPEFTPGHLNEVVSPHSSAGASLIISDLLSQKRDLPLALIDGHDSFDPASYGNEKCRRLIWLRCAKTEQAIQCADLLLRDGNLPFILLDLHLVSARELRQIPNALWHRLKIQARDSGAALLALTPRALVPTPHRRLTLASRFTLAHLEQRAPRLSFQSTERDQLAGKA